MTEITTKYPLYIGYIFASFPTLCFKTSCWFTWSPSWDVQYASPGRRSPASSCSGGTAACCGRRSSKKSSLSDECRLWTEMSFSNSNNVIILKSQWLKFHLLTSTTFLSVHWQNLYRHNLYRQILYRQNLYRQILYTTKPIQRHNLYMTKPIHDKTYTWTKPRCDRTYTRQILYVYKTAYIYIYMTIPIHNSI